MRLGPWSRRSPAGAWREARRVSPGDILIGGLIWSAGRAVKLGLLGGMLFNLLLAPMWLGQTSGNLLLAALHVPLLRYDFPPLFARCWKQQPQHQPKAGEVSSAKNEAIPLPALAESLRTSEFVTGV